MIFNENKKEDRVVITSNNKSKFSSNIKMKLTLEVEKVTFY